MRCHFVQLFAQLCDPPPPPGVPGRPMERVLASGARKHSLTTKLFTLSPSDLFAESRLCSSRLRTPSPPASTEALRLQSIAHMTYAKDKDKD